MTETNHTGDELSPAELVERVIFLDPVRIGDVDVAALAQSAALAHELAVKVERGETTDVDVTTLVCHASVLTDDLYELATVTAERQARPPAPPPSSEPSRRAPRRSWLSVLRRPLRRSNAAGEGPAPTSPPSAPQPSAVDWLYRYIDALEARLGTSEIDAAVAEANRGWEANRG